MFIISSITLRIIMFNSTLNYYGEDLQFNDDQLTFGLQSFCGCIAMVLVAALNGLAGLGGGGPHLAILIHFFNILPKNGTIIIFACILGTSLGNVINQMRRALDGEAVIKYGFSAITMPMMFMGAILGVYCNKLAPSLVTISIMVYLSAKGVPKMTTRFKEGYARETGELEAHRQLNRDSGVIKESRINPFEDAINVKIFKQILLLILCFLILSLCKGSEKFNSIVGVQQCSIIFWIIQSGVIGLAFYFYRSNMSILITPNPTIGEELFQTQQTIQTHKGALLRNGVLAGVLSGLGLGGGVVLIPVYRELGLNPVQASATGSFNVFVISMINVIQALLLGVLSLKQFFFFFGVTVLGSYSLSTLLGSYLRKINRTSLVELMLLFLTLVICVTLPLSLWQKVVSAGGDWMIIMGFGSIC